MLGKLDIYNKRMKKKYSVVFPLKLTFQLEAKITVILHITNSILEGGGERTERYEKEMTVIFEEFSNLNYLMQSFF